MKPALRHRPIFFLCGTAAVLVLLLLGMTFRGGKGAQPVGLSVTFVGLTNNPVAELKRYGLLVPATAKGRCALFRFQNEGRARSIAWEIVGVEELTAQGWKVFRPNARWEGGYAGMKWPPGSSGLQAIGWPPGLPTNGTWRLSLRWGPEFIAPAKVINYWAGKPIFNERSKLPFVGYSSPVTATGPNHHMQ
jgi:hypothetical protein